MSRDLINDLIFNNVIFTGRQAATGFTPTKCRLCNDYQSRAGFKNDGEHIIYHCFNCSAHSTYTIGNHLMSNKFRNILQKFDIPDNQITACLGKIFLENGGTDTNQTVHKTENTAPSIFIPKEIDLPPDTFSIHDIPDDYEYKSHFLNYLHSRGLDEYSYDWMISIDPAHYNRLIIPYRRRGKVIFWQGRYIDSIGPSPLEKFKLKSDPKYKILRYLSPSISTGKRGILFNYDELYRYTNDPLFITEGAIDSISIGLNSIALSGSTIDTEISDLINSTARNREKIIVVDRFDPQNNGYKLGCKAIELGWKISHYDGQITDSNNALIELGDIIMSDMLHNNIKEGFAAKVMLEMIKTRKGKSKNE